MTVTIYQGNSRDILPTLPANSVQCCVTSPPYWGLRDYGVDGQLGLEATPELYAEHLVEIFREVKRVLRDDGVCWLNLGDSYASGKGTCYNPGGGADSLGQNRKAAGAHPLDRGNKSTLALSGLKPKDLVGIPWMVAFALQADGWYLRSDIIWHKPNCMPESVTDRPTKAHEYIFLLTKSARYFYDAEAIKEESVYAGDNRGERADSRRGTNMNSVSGATPSSRNKRTVWTVPTQPYSGAHFATFPPALIEPMIKAGTSERGCCPECGAGWERVTERKGIRELGLNRDNRGEKTAEMKAQGLRTWDLNPTISGACPEVKTIGWQPTCTCGVDVDSGALDPNTGAGIDVRQPFEPIPCTVLDPFAGAGTVGLVADRLQRDAILIELNPEYAEMARRRIENEAPMFANVKVLNPEHCLEEVGG